MTTLIAVRKKVMLPAPYVGRPFVYAGRCTLDQYFAGAFGELQLVYAHPDAAFTRGPFEYTHEARNGHNPDTPVWP